MSWTIRPEVPADVPTIAEMEQAAYGFAVTPDMVVDEASAPSFAAYVAERDGRIIGRSKTGFMPEHTPADDLRCAVVVHPAERGHGVGVALWDALQPTFRARRPVHLRANGNGFDMDSVAWAQRRGFAVAHRLYFQALDLTGFDAAPWLQRLETVKSRGFQFVPFSHLHTPETEVRLHRLYHELLADTPDYTDGDDKPFDSWRDWAFESAGSWPEGWLIAVGPDGEWAGLTFMQKSSGSAHIFMTGVASAFRGQGVAVPLKVAAALYAKAQGLSELTTLNHAANERILSINRTMGYRVTEDVLRLVKQCEWT